MLETAKKASFFSSWIKIAGPDMQDDNINMEVLRDQAEMAARNQQLQEELSFAQERLDLLEDVLAPRLKAIFTLRALRFALRERNRIRREAANAEMSLANTGAVFTPTQPKGVAHWPGFGIAVFGHTRVDCIQNTLESLACQDAIHVAHVFLDGDQGKPALKRKIDQVHEIVKAYPVKAVHRQRSGFGFRKMMLIAGDYMLEHYDRILFLEDDCFPIDNAIANFNEELDAVADRADVFSVYGHHFSVDGETEFFRRFQGWGWATTRKKLKPIWEELRQCYLMSEPEYLDFVNEKLTPEIAAQIDITPGRQPSDTLLNFFAWDETVCLLTAVRGQAHKRSAKRLVYNCGGGLESSHFKNVEQFRQPPFNMIGVDEVWDYFQSNAGVATGSSAAD